MIYNDEDSRYKQAVDTLKQLPKVNAPLNFEADLMRRINQNRFEEKYKESFWDILLTPARLIPSAALAAAAVIMFFMLNTAPADQPDPLAAEPRVREDVTQTGTPSGFLPDEQMLENRSERSGSGAASLRQENTPGTRFTTASNITKAGLNFRQIQLTDEEKAALNKLKARIQQYINRQKQEGK